MVAKVLLAQLGLTLVLAILFWGTDGRVSGYSALLGGLTWLSLLTALTLMFRLALQGFALRRYARTRPRLLYYQFLSHQRPPLL